MSKLTVVEQDGVFTDVIKLTAADLLAIGNGGQQVIAKKPAYSGVELCVVAETTAVTGTSTLVIDIGTTTADPDEYIDALDVDAMTAPVANTGDAFNDDTTAGVINAVDFTNAAEDIVIEVTDANIANITAGEILIGLRIVDLGRFV